MSNKNDKNKKIYTIGHSNLSTEDFLQLLLKYHIQVLVDVRAKPYSKYAKEYNKESINPFLLRHQIKYMFMGDLLGGPSKDENYILIDGSADYTKREQNINYLNGILRLEEGIEKYTIAIMCSEKDPSNCHRHILVSKTLVEDGIDVFHILEDGSIKTAKEIGFARQESLFKEMS